MTAAPHIPPPVPHPGPLTRLAAGAYGLLWRVARPVLRRNARMADGFAERLVPKGWMTEHADIWVQAASGGEARLAVGLVEALAHALKADPTLPALTVLATTWTRQGHDILEQCRLTLMHATSPVRLLVRFIPLDEPALMIRALDQASPGLLVLLETELWPGLLLACSRRRVPVLFANARMREATARRYAWAAPVWRQLAPRRICAMAAPDAERFARIFPGVPVTIIPNIKFDLAVPPAAHTMPSHADNVAALLPADGLPRVLLASIREEEEHALVQAMAARLHPPDVSDAQGTKPDAEPQLLGLPVRLIIAPRHLHRVAAWQEHLTSLGLPFCLRSQCATPDGPLPLTPRTVVIWDAFGELPGLYQVANVVFVGGSLAPLGGQNFLEPLAAGVVPIVGPDTSNFDWTLGAGPDIGPDAGQDIGPNGSASLEARGLLQRVHDAPHLLTALRAAVAGSAPQSGRAAIRTAFAAWLAPRQGGAARTAAVALQLLAQGCAETAKTG